MSHRPTHQTPGPWEIVSVVGENTLLGTVTRSTATVRRWNGADGDVVATVRSGHAKPAPFNKSYGGVSHVDALERAKVVDANARLVSRSPVLLAALTDLLNWYDMDEGDLRQLMNAARDAIEGIEPCACPRCHKSFDQEVTDQR